MALPLIAVGVLARILLRGGIVAARKYAAKNGVRISANVLSKAKNINKTKKVNPRIKVKDKKTTKTTDTKTKTKTKPKVEMKNISAKNKNIAKKVDKKSLATKNKTTKTTTKKVDKKVDKKSIATKNKPKKIKAKPSNTNLIKKADKKTTTKVDKKSLATKNKTTKTKTTKTTDKKVDKKSLATKKKTDTKTKTKPKPKPTVAPVAPFAVGGGMLLGGLIASQKKKGKPNVLKIERKDKPSPDPKKSIGGTGRGEGALEFARRKTDAKVKEMKAKQSLEDRKLYNNRVDTYESRIRAMVKKKDQLKTIDAKDGSGRNQYQVEMNKLKKENPKEFRKMFKLGGFGNLKD